MVEHGDEDLRMTSIATALCRVNRKPCRRCRCYIALHVGTRCYGVLPGERRCTCTGLICGVDRERRAGWVLCSILVGLLGLAMGGF